MSVLPVAGAGAAPAVGRPRALETVRVRSEALRERHPAVSLWLILTVAFIVVLDFSIVNVALASIERELHVGAVSVQWVITGYAITFGGLLVLGGRLGDIFGRRRMFVAGLVVFSLGSLAGGMAPDLLVLVAARAVQGIGAAVVAPAALSLITTTMPEGAPRNRALGLYGATASIGFVAGLVLGGFLVQFFDWRSVLWVNVPVGLAAAALAPFLLPRSASSTRTRLDVGGAVLVTGAIAALVYGISEGPALGWLDVRILASFVAAISLGLAFVAVERRHAAPLVPMGIFSMRALRNANAMTVLLGVWNAGELLVLPLYLQLVLHYSPLVAGLSMAPQGVIGLLAASQGPRLVQRLGSAKFLACAAAVAAGGLGLLGFSLVTHDYGLLVVGFMLAGFGTAASAFGTTVVATHGVVHGEQGLAGGLINMSRQVGAAIGVAIVAAVIGDTVTAGASVGSDRLAVVIAAAAALLAAGLAVVGFSRRGGRPAGALAEVHQARHSRTVQTRRVPALVGGPYRAAMCRARRAFELTGDGAVPRRRWPERPVDIDSVPPPVRTPIR